MMMRLTRNLARGLNQRTLYAALAGSGATLFLLRVLIAQLYG